MLYYVIFLSIAEVAVTWVRKNRSTDVFVWENYKQNKETPHGRSCYKNFFV